LAAAATLAACGSDDEGTRSPGGTSPTSPPGPAATSPGPRPATEAQARAVLERHRADLMRRPGVVGSGLGKGSRDLRRTDDYEIHVFLREARYRTALPTALEGVPVRPVVTGTITAQ
jgi:hypothetical protein